jgi:sugar phosphate permease
MVSDMFPPERRARPISVIAIGSLCGGGLGFIASSSLLDASSLDLFDGIPLLGDLAPWRTVLVLVGLPGLLVGVLLMTVREPRRDGVSAAAGEQRQGRDQPPSLRQVARFVWQHRSSLGLVSLGAALIVLTYYSTVSWGPTVLVRQHGLSVSQAGYLYGGFLLISSIAGSYAGGALSDRRAARGDDGIYLRIITFCAAGIALAMIAMLLTSSVTAMVACLSFYSFSYGLIQGPVIAYVHRLTPSSMRGLVSSLYVLTVNVIGYVIGPSAVALVSTSLPGGEQSLGPALGVVCLVSAAGALLVCLLARKPSRQALRACSVEG